MLTQCTRCGGLYETEPFRFNLKLPYVSAVFGGQACRCTAPLKQPTAQPQYREPTLADARLVNGDDIGCADLLRRLKQLGFVRKVQP